MVSRIYILSLKMFLKLSKILNMIQIECSCLFLPEHNKQSWVYILVWCQLYIWCQISWNLLTEDDDCPPPSPVLIRVNIGHSIFTATNSNFDEFHGQSAKEYSFLAVSRSWGVTIAWTNVWHLSYISDIEVIKNF